MKKILNSILGFVIIFVATFCWIYYASKLLRFSAICSAVLSVCLTILFANLPPKQAKTDYEKFGYYLILHGEEITLQLLKYLGYDLCPLAKDFQAVKNQTVFYCAFRYNEKSLCVDETASIFNVARKNGYENVIIFCNKADKQCHVFSKSNQLPIQFVTAFDLANLLGKYQMMPDYSAQKVTKNFFVASYAFSSKRFTGYVFSSLFVYATSFISYFKIYKLIWATVILALAFYSKFNKRFNGKQSVKDVL